LLTFNVSGQERLTPFYDKGTIKQKDTISSLSLPFYDSFSQEDIFPKDELWIDNEAFINNTYPVSQINYGVATLDALDSLGNIYENANTISFQADHLTSKTIRLDSIFDTETNEMTALTEADSIYFSFYYQPQGKGDIPAKNDSLILLFAGEDSTGGIHWQKVWAAEGSSLDDFYSENGTYFKYVMIPVLKEEFFTPHFQFQFINYASLSTTPSWQSNTDHWHIDNVYLDKDRNINDIYYPDVDFVNSIPRLLNRYTSIPMKHYKATYSVDDFDVIVGNTCEEALDLNYQFSIDLFGDTLLKKSYSGISPGFDHTSVFTNIDFHYNLTILNEDSIGIHINESLASEELDIIHQRESDFIFYNYFAYDDGSPEGGYSLGPKNSSAAYKYTLNKPDTLRGMKIYFNRTMSGSNIQYFKIKVWEISGNKPGTLQYESQSFKPEIDPNTPNDFITFVFPDGGVALSANDYFIGWTQSINPTMNVAWDRNNDNHDLLYINTNGNWQQSSLEGTLMMRPVFGKTITSVGDHTNNKQLTIFPNPYRSGPLTLTIENGSHNHNMNVTIYNSTGQKVYQGEYAQQIDLSFLQTGFYMIEVVDKTNGIQSIQKLIINK
jgi:hypothetical protein